MKTFMLLGNVFLNDRILKTPRINVVTTIK